MAFEQHYVRTSDQPTSWQYTLMSDRESSYDRECDGEPVTDAIANAAEIPQRAAEDIQLILEAEHDDFDSGAMGEETEFAGDSRYEEKGASDEAWQEERRNFEKSLKTEARFFSRTSARHLASIFDGIDELCTRSGRPLVVGGGPGTDFHLCLSRTGVSIRRQARRGALPARYPSRLSSGVRRGCGPNECARNFGFLWRQRSEGRDRGGASSGG